MESQLSLFDTQQDTDQDAVPMDVRSSGQVNREIAYDVGERIGGARKDEYELRKQFEQNHNIKNLRELEEHSTVLAAEMVSRKTLFSDFSLRDEKSRGTEPSVARIKQLIIQRIPQYPTVDSPEGREMFMEASKYVDKKMKDVYTIDQLIKFVYTVRDRIIKDRIIFNGLGRSFNNFFLSAASANGTINRVVSQVNSWDDLLKKRTRRTRTRNTPVWERDLPEKPIRKGGVESFIKTPEELMNTFNLRAVEFGHYLNDKIGEQHIFRCSEAFYDLQDALNLKDNSISFDGKLAMAFGSRGRGSALGHYEPRAKVINLTRDRGTLGILAHEWFHGLDNYLYDLSHDFKNGQVGYVSDLDGIGPNLSHEVINLFNELTESLKKGNSVINVKNENKEGTTWRLNNLIKNTYRTNSGDLFQSIMGIKRVLDENLNSRLKMYDGYTNQDRANKYKGRAIRKRDRDMKKIIQALAWHHEQKSGERVDTVPLPTNRTKFYDSGLKLDRRNIGRYWSSNRELAARSFEAYIEDKLSLQDRSNDYLVCGTKDEAAFPIGEERQTISKKYDALFNQLSREGIL